MLEEKLLEAYKQYDYLSSVIKIFVSYIKPSFLFKSEILTPVHLGRAVAEDSSKDGKISNEDINWLYENCIGDNSFDGNISYMNRRVGFLTGTYMAWKNYKTLGNPEYFGSFGYRRLLKPVYFDKIQTLDFIAPAKKQFGYTLEEQFIAAHGNKLYEVMVNTVKTVFPEDFELFKEYFKEKSGYFFEIYIMKKEHFFDFCDWIFAALFYMLEVYKHGIEQHSAVNFDNLLIKFLETDEETLKEKFLPKTKGKEIRDVAFILERLTGFYLYKLTQNKNLKYMEVPVIEFDRTNMLAVKDVILTKMRERVQNK